MIVNVTLSLRTSWLAVPVNPRAAPHAGIVTRLCLDERGRDKGRFRTQAEGRHVHLSTDVKVFPCGRSEQLPSALVTVALAVIVEVPNGRSGSQLIEDSSLFSLDSPAWSPTRRGSANARNTRCSCSASIPGPCTRLVSRSFFFYAFSDLHRAQPKSDSSWSYGPLDGCALVSCGARSWLESHSSSDRATFAACREKMSQRPTRTQASPCLKTLRREKRAGSARTPTEPRREYVLESALYPLD